MRSDMFKVIVERPRTGKSWDVLASRRRFDWDGPSRARMREGLGHVGLNENLRPLERYLKKQVGRPWDKVMSEISANIDRRNTVQQHVFEHLHDFVAMQVAWRDGVWIDLRRPWLSHRGTWLRQPLFVHPRTGLLRVNEDYRGHRRRHRAFWATKEAEIAGRRRSLGNGRWHLLLDGEWFEVTVVPMPQVEIVDVLVKGRVRRQRKAPRVFDVVLKQYVRGEAFDIEDRAKELYGSSTLYATSKRQLSKREIEKFELPR